MSVEAGSLARIQTALADACKREGILLQRMHLKGVAVGVPPMDVEVDCEVRHR